MGKSEEQRAESALICRCFEAPNLVQQCARRPLKCALELLSGQRRRIALHEPTSLVYREIVKASPSLVESTSRRHASAMIRFACCLRCTRPEEASAARSRIVHANRKAMLRRSAQRRCRSRADCGSFATPKVRVKFGPVALNRSAGQKLISTCSVLRQEKYAVERLTLLTSQ